MMTVTHSEEAFARLRAHPDFPAAIAASAAGSLALHQGNRLMNWMLSDRARALFPYLLFYLDATARPDDPRSGLTAARMKALCEEIGICSPGRGVALLALLRLGGHIAPGTSAGDLRVRRLLPTEKLKDMQRARLRRQFEALAMVEPRMRDAQPLVGDAGFERMLWLRLGERFLGGFCVLDYAPDLRLFSERGSGMMVLYALMLAGEPGDAMPPRRPVKLSIAAMARRFGVSRTHVLRLLRRAEGAGLLERVPGQPDRLLLKPRLIEALYDMFAAMFVLLGGAAQQAAADVRAQAASA